MSPMVAKSRYRARLRRRDRLRQLRHPRRRDRPRADPRGDRGARPTPDADRRRPSRDGPSRRTEAAGATDEQLDLPYDQEADQ